MLSTSDIHFLIEQEINSGSFQNRGYEPEELDEAVNASMFRLIDETLTKVAANEKSDKVILENNEKILLRELTKSFRSIPIDNTTNLPEDYSSKINAESIVYRTDCGIKKPKSIVEGLTLRAKGDVKYNDNWYADGEIFTTVDLTKNFYGEVEQLPTKDQNAIFVENDVFGSFETKSLTQTLYTIVGKKVQLKSKYNIASFHLNYISTNDQFKMDSCTNKTLTLSETLQRWVIDKTILRLAARGEETQQKIENFKQL